MARLRQSSKMQGNYKATIRNNYPHKKVLLSVNRRTKIRIKKA